MKYPIGIQDFESIRKGNYVYIDKTAFIHRLANAGRYYFLSRPRRFGKSLLISTMEAYFSGRKELFEGLAAEQLEMEWTAYPILHLDLNTGAYRTEDDLNAVLNEKLCEWEKLYGINPAETTPELRFKGIVRRAAERCGQGTVILVDEYDKPLLQAIENEPLQDTFRQTLKAFYSVLKTQDRYIKFAFLTGVTKFSKISVFSDLNNVEDISMSEHYQTICGISETELHTYLEEPVRQLAEARNLTFQETCLRLKEQYDGYRFTEDGTGIYNPFSLLNVFKELKFKDYWFETDTPSFLVYLLKKSRMRLSDITRRKLTSDRLNSIYAIREDPLPVLYQSGYLTIQDYDPVYQKYRLGFPNKEVERGFINYLLPAFTMRDARTEFDVEYFIEDAENGQPDRFMKRLQTFFADCDYQVAGEAELYFQNAMYLIFKILGFYARVEQHTENGRIDVCLQTKGYIYVFELKLDGSAQEALEQIDTKHYLAPFAMDRRKQYKIGVNFDSSQRGIKEYVIEEER